MSKAAMDNLTKQLALELAPNGIRCNSVNPGVVATNLNDIYCVTEDDYQK